MAKKERIEIIMNKAEYKAGENVYVKVFLHFDKPIKARGIQAIFHCHEKKKDYRYTTIAPDEARRMKELGEEVTSTVKRVEMITESNRFEEKHMVAGPGEYTEKEFNFFLKIPDKAPSTSYEMGHDNRTHNWMLKIKMDIQFAPDINAEKEVIVLGEL